jgi:hypothetical protein
VYPTRKEAAQKKRPHKKEAAQKRGRTKKKPHKKEAAAVTRRL